MLDRDLSELYGVETKRLKEQVRRNTDRFPPDFMFELSEAEFANSRSQFATLKRGQHAKYLRFAFSEQGEAMLSGVLKSKLAIQINIQIMRAFVQLRHLVINHAGLKRELEELRNQTEDRFKVVFTVLDRLVSDDNGSDKKIGFIGSE
jgi:hypothetical protein